LSVGDELDDFKSEYNKLEIRITNLDEDNEFLRYENNKLMNENESLCKGYKALSVEVRKLRAQNQNEHEFSNEELMHELEELKIENAILKSCLDESQDIMAKFVQGEKNSNAILGQQRYTLNKNGIRYKGTIRDKVHKSYFVKATSKTCNYYGNFGHIAHKCPI